MNRLPRPTTTLFALAAAASGVSATAELFNMRYVFDDTQLITTTILQIDPSLPGIPMDRGIRDIERMYMDNSGEVYLAVELERNQQINGQRPDLWVHVGTDVEDGIGTPFLMQSDNPEAIYPSTYAPLTGNYLSNVRASDLVAITSDGLLIESRRSENIPKGGRSGYRLEHITGIESGSPSGQVFFDTVAISETSLSLPNIDAGSTNVAPAIYHSTWALMEGGNEAILIGHDTPDYSGNYAYYSLDTSSAGTGVTRLFGAGDTLNLVGGGSVTLGSLQGAGLRLRSDAQGLAGLINTNPDTSSTLLAQAQSGDWFEIGTTGQALSYAPHVVIEPLGFSNSSFHAVSETGASIYSIYAKNTDTGVTGTGLILSDPTTATAKLIAMNGDALNDGTGRKYTDFNGVSSGSARFGFSDTVLFNGQFSDAAGTTSSDALFAYSIADDSVSTLLYEGMRLDGTDYVLDGNGFTLTAFNDNLGMGVAVLRVDDLEGNRIGRLIASFDREGNVTVELGPEEILAVAGTEVLVGDALGTIRNFGEHSGLTDAGQFLVHFDEIGVVGFTLSSVPEPASLLLVVGGACLMVGRRRQRP